ncbi:MAG: Gfo/Idh/MocA family oxidoreductase [Pseudomonadota bacterium]
MTGLPDLRVACIGAGYFSQFHYDAWARISGCVLVGACDPDAAAREAHAPGVAGFRDAEAMLAEIQPDIVDIITPPPTHRALLGLALKARPRAIICQKPFCTGLAEARALAEQAETAGVPVVVHENFRFQPWYRKLREMILAGALGDVMQITFRLRPGDGQGPRAYLDRQPYFQKMPRFLIHETGVHWVDTFRYLLGSPQTVWADLRQLNPAISGEDAGLVVFGYDDGRRALFDGNRLADHVAENRRRTMGECLVEGTAATAMLDGAGRIFVRPFGANDWQAVDFDAPETGFGGDCVHALQSHVVAALRSGESDGLENTARDYLAVIEMEEAIYRSAESGRRVVL